jgi:hypothetical protein
MQVEHLITFESRPEKFRIAISHCENLDCDCQDLMLEFVEVTRQGRQQRKKSRFWVSIEMESWSVIEPEAPPPHVARLIREFMDKCPNWLRNELLAELQIAKAEKRRIKIYTLEPYRVLKGDLVPFSKVACETGSISDHGQGYFSQHVYRSLTGEEYRFLIDDAYCTNPDCDCQEVHLLFWMQKREESEAGAPSIVLSRSFEVRMSLAGEWSVHACHNCTPGFAADAYAQWLAQIGDDDCFERRYEIMKEVGRRSLKNRVPEPILARQASPAPSPAFPSLNYLGSPLSATAAVPSREAVHRNDPCPCGSGKKYKRCCARADSGSSILPR